MVTIRDIAREAECSVSTVSRALSGHQDVSADTRARVLTVVEKYNYVQNRFAQGLKQTRSSTIGVVVKGRENYMFAAILEMIQAGLSDAGLLAAVEYVGAVDDEVSAGVQMSHRLRPAGLVFLGGEARRFDAGFDRIGLPTVVLTDSVAEVARPGLSSAFTDDAAGAASAVSYLVERGHRRIGVVAGPVELSDASRLRLEGCLQAFHAQGIDFDRERDMVRSLYAMPDSYKATRTLVGRRSDLTAIFCMSDRMAMGCVRALQDMSLSVPRDVSVMGYDGIDLTAYFLPRIATIRQDQRQLAATGVALMVRHLGGDLTPAHVRVPFTLVEGESVASPARA
ncbi:MAG: LacI family transcriptional regulator [Bifidobacteriaceae bacterium]|nr:LacI family transcriptional regulator [Bifidobacteriaceae bacterium]